MKDDVVLAGGGGHCKVVIDAIRKQGRYHIFGITDTKGIGSSISGIPVIGTDEVLEGLLHKGISNAFITVGSAMGYDHRRYLYNRLGGMGFDFINVIHPGAVIGEGVILGRGNAIMAGSIINPYASIGNNCIINTAAIVEHDCIIEGHVHIAPGAKIAGTVRIGEATHIGLGADIIEGVTIGKNCVIGAGAVVIRDIPDNSVAVGVPARVIKRV